MKYDIPYVNGLSGCSSNHRRDMIRYFENLPEEMRLSVFEAFYENLIIHNKLKLNQKNIEYMYSMFMKSISTFMGIESAMSRKRSLSDKELSQLLSLKISRVKNKKKPKRTLKYLIINEHIGLIRELRNRGESWEWISTYLDFYHKISVTSVYLRVIFNELHESTG